MRIWIANVARLCVKEWRCLLHDRPMMALIVFAFSVAIHVTAVGIKAEVANASVGVIDDDHSKLSMQLRDAIQLPYFKPAVDTTPTQAMAALDRGELIFVLQVPPHYEADVLAGRSPSLQLLVDATAMTQAGLGVAYLQQIVLRETLAFTQRPQLESLSPVDARVRVLYNPNGDSRWFTAVMQIVTNVTVLAIILVGAAVIREREHGTIEHLLVMPVRASEIAFGKIVANGAVIVVAMLASLWGVVHLWLGIDLTGSLGLTLLSTTLYLFSVCALGVMLATFASSMPQFGLLSAPVYAVLYLLSGAATPVDSMPSSVQAIVKLSPTTQFVSLVQAVLYRDAKVLDVWPQLLTISALGVVFVTIALARFRDMLARQA